MADRDTAKAWLRLDTDSDDALVDSLLAWAETHIRSRSTLATSDAFPPALDVAQLTLVANRYENRGDVDGQTMPDVGVLMAGYYKPPIG